MRGSTRPSKYLSSDKPDRQGHLRLNMDEALGAKCLEMLVMVPLRGAPGNAPAPAPGVKVPQLETPRKPRSPRPCQRACPEDKG